MLTEIETARALRRSEPRALAALPLALAKLQLIEVEQTIRATAAAYEDPALGSLDAIHLATAQILATNSGGLFTAMLSYGKRLLDAARRVGLTAVDPGQS